MSLPNSKCQLINVTNMWHGDVFLTKKSLHTLVNFLVKRSLISQGAFTFAKLILVRLFGSQIFRKPILKVFLFLNISKKLKSKVIKKFKQAHDTAFDLPLFWHTRPFIRIWSNTSYMPFHIQVTYVLNMFTSPPLPTNLDVKRHMLFANSSHCLFENNETCGKLMEYNKDK
jgi:hypothetical protein